MASAKLPPLKSREVSRYPGSVTKLPGKLCCSVSLYCTFIVCLILSRVVEVERDLLYRVNFVVEGSTLTLDMSV